MIPTQQDLWRIKAWTCFEVGKQIEQLHGSLIAIFVNTNFWRRQNAFLNLTKCAFYLKHAIDILHNKSFLSPCFFTLFVKYWENLSQVVEEIKTENKNLSGLSFYTTLFNGIRKTFWIMYFDIYYNSINSGVNVWL